MSASLYTILVCVSSCLAENLISNVNVEQHAAIEKDLVSVNLYKSAGDWVLRATTGNANYGRLNIYLNHDVNFRNFQGDKVIGSGIWRHINGSKIIETEFEWKSKRDKQSKLLFFHQCQKVLIYVIARHNNYVALKVLANDYENKAVDNEYLQQLISGLMARPGIRPVLEPLVATLHYVNDEVPPISYLANHAPVNETVAVDWDLSNSAQEWRVVASSSPSDISHLKCELVEDQLMCNLYNERGWIGKSTEESLEDSKVILVRLYLEEYAQHQKIVAYADDDILVAIEWPNGHANLEVYAVGNKAVNAEHIRKVIDNHLLISQDLKGVIKDLVPKLVWK